MNATKGSITLVGAGPGDPELITLKALKALQIADVIFYDALLNKDLLEYNPSAEKYFVGKRMGHHSMKQNVINQLLVDYALAGKKVVRLKGGDVSVFGRAAEELQNAQLYDIPTTLIPGISCYSSIVAQHKIPLTKRCEHESFWVTTGYTCKGTISPDIALAAQSSATVVILMGMSKLAEIVEVFKKYKSPEYPIAIIQNDTLPNECSLLGTLENIVENVHNHGLSNPAVIIVGKAVIDPITAFRNLKNEALLL